MTHTQAMEVIRTLEYTFMSAPWRVRVSSLVYDKASDTYKAKIKYTRSTYEGSTFPFSKEYSRKHILKMYEESEYFQSRALSRKKFRGIIPTK